MMNGPPVKFSELPLDKEHAATKLNAWGAYGPDDEIGFLNRQTDAIVAAAAASEIKIGMRVSLNADMEFQGDKPLFGRQVFQKNGYQKAPRIVHDDTWHFNTQSATQWDGLRHFGYQAAKRFYNNTTLEDIAGTSPKSETNPHILGIQNIARRGIFGRAVLVDFARWIAPGHPGYEIVRDATGGVGYQHFKRSAIKTSWLQACLAYQGTQVTFGDILVVRTGFFAAYAACDANLLDELSQMVPPTVGGVEASDELFEWIWDNFSAVAGDQPAFEQIPMEHPISAHEVLLAGWGCPIGELFDLEEVAAVCERLGRWSFFMSSEVLNVKGGVASPPNAVALF